MLTHPKAKAASPLLMGRFAWSRAGRLSRSARVARLHEKGEVAASYGDAPRLAMDDALLRSMRFHPAMYADFFVAQNPAEQVRP